MLPLQSSDFYATLQQNIHPEAEIRIPFTIKARRMPTTAHGKDIMFKEFVIPAK
jgi:hypothetical protein